MHQSLFHLARPALPTLGRVGKAVVVAVAASLAYVLGWEGTVRSGFAPGTVVLALAGCLVVGIAVTTLGFRLADVRRPAVGGAYVGVLLVVYAAAFVALYGTESISWAAWPAIAAQLAVIYAIQQGGAARPGGAGSAPTMGGRDAEPVPVRPGR
jgi:hypothetical protein